MSIDSLMSDEIYVESPDGEQSGPFKASVQRNKVYVKDQSLVAEEGGKILRKLSNGKAESYSILEVNFHQGPRGSHLSHYEILVRKDSSQVPIPFSTTVNISNSQGIQIGDNNVQNIVSSLESLVEAVDSANFSDEEKRDAKDRLRAFVEHPLTNSILGSAASKLIGML